MAATTWDCASSTSRTAASRNRTTASISRSCGSSTTWTDFSLHEGKEFRRFGLEAFVGHPPAARHVVVREPPRLLLHPLGERLVPIGALVGRRDELLDDRPSRFFE